MDTGIPRLWLLLLPGGGGGGIVLLTDVHLIRSHDIAHLVLYLCRPAFLLDTVLHITEDVVGPDHRMTGFMEDRRHRRSVVGIRGWLPTEKQAARSAGWPGGLL